MAAKSKFFARVRGEILSAEFFLIMHFSLTS